MYFKTLPTFVKFKSVCGFYDTDKQWAEKF